MRVIYMPNSARRERSKAAPVPPTFSPAVLAGGTGATAVAGFTAYKFWETIMLYKWVILFAIIMFAIIVYFVWKSMSGPKEDEPEEE